VKTNQKMTESYMYIVRVIKKCIGASVVPMKEGNRAKE